MSDNIRMGWDEYFYKMAAMASTRATCPRRHVGCVVVYDNRLLATGYNGSPPGEDHCDKYGCIMQDNHCVRTVHAEANAIAQAAAEGISLYGSTAYVTFQPCIVCCKLLLSAGVHKVVSPMMGFTPLWQYKTHHLYSKLIGKENGDEYFDRLEINTEHTAQPFVNSPPLFQQPPLNHDEMAALCEAADGSKWSLQIMRLVAELRSWRGGTNAVILSDSTTATTNPTISNRGPRKADQ